MSRFTYTEQDSRVRLIVLPVFLLLLNTITLGERFWSDWRVFLLTNSLGFILYFGHWFVNNAIALHSHRRFPSYRQAIRRILITTSLAAINSLSVTLLIMWIYSRLGYPVAVSQQVWAVLFVFIMVVAVTAVYEGIHAFEQWRHYFMESEQLKKAQLQSQLEALKQQVNPHFLFNSLNILDALIEEDPTQAREFLNEMSSVYRYLLRSNEQNLTPLSSELEFINSYFHLLRTRHGQALNLVTHISPQYVDHQLPPLTLQLLIENAVKHNVILPDRPLTIEIATDDRAQLTVRNNLQRKHIRVASNGVGISNILTKYRVLGQGTPTFTEDEQQFVVTLPLVAA
ncbi:sensor histidine kinase [Fibrisoma montanum]|nr:sensor histidine kinase [Fibrisoma montanum]